MKSGRIQKIAIAVLLVLQTNPLRAQNTPEHTYQPLPSLNGKLQSVGSDTLANLMLFWTQAFGQYYPALEFELHSEGSATAPPALLSGQANIAPMSRLMSAAELAGFQQQFGYLPTPVRVAVDAIAVYVHQQNPLNSITLAQLAGVFAKGKHCHNGQGLSRWDELGLGGSWSSASIDLIGRNADSGSYGFFKEVVLCNAAFSSEMQKLPGSASIVQAISYNPNAIGFSGLGYKTSGVKALAIMQDGVATYASHNAANWNYPLSRYLYLYLNKAPGQPLTPLLREFILLVLSASGQHIVERDGYISVSETVRMAELGKLDLLP